MREDGARSPWWYRQRVWAIGAIYWLSFYPAYGIPGVLHQSTVPLYASFGAQHDRLALGVAALVALLGWLLRASGTQYIREIVWQRNARTDRLCVAGPFRYTRNPLYLGNLLLAAAIGAFAPPLGWPIVVLAQWIFLRGLIAEEELLLRARYGARFDEYCARVPRLLPRVLPVENEPMPHATLSSALLAEAFTGGIVAGLAILAVSDGSAWRWSVGAVAAGIALQVYARRDEAAQRRA